MGAGVKAYGSCMEVRSTVVDLDEGVYMGPDSRPGGLVYDDDGDRGPQEPIYILSFLEKYLRNTTQHVNVLCYDALRFYKMRERRGWRGSGSPCLNACSYASMGEDAC